MWRAWLRRTGVVRATVLVTLAGVLASVAITVAVETAVQGHVAPIGLVLSVAVPALVATPVNAIIFSLLYRLDAAEEQLRALTCIDPLTGAFNRRHAFEEAERELQRVRRYGGRFALLLLDADEFKAINDNHGHLAGDALLRAVSELCRSQSRRTDVFARYGGEEFMLLMPATDVGPAFEFAERLRAGIAALEVPHGEQLLRVTASFGVATGGRESANVDAVVSAADTALYCAKHMGRNRVCSAEETAPESAAA